MKKAFIGAEAQVNIVICSTDSWST